jgi:transcriptional regulator with XRE-family HTH domain
VNQALPPFAAFGARLRALRVERGLSQQSLADAAGVAYRSVQYLEAGSRVPQHDTLVALADALGVPYVELRLVLGRPSAAEALTDAELDVLAERLAVRLAPALAAEVQRLLNLER